MIETCLHLSMIEATSRGGSIDISKPDKTN